MRTDTPCKPGLVSRRGFMRRAAETGAGALAAAALPALHGAEGAAPRRPNLLFVFSDEQSWDMLGCYGNEQIITPNLDRLASQGIRFNHCVSASPVCTPYRGMLLSGQHPLRCGALYNDVRLLTDNGLTFGQVLRDAGYRMGYVGKWHLYGGDRDRPIPPGPHRHGFDGVFRSNNCHVNYAPGQCFYWNEAGEKVFFPEWEVFGQTRQALEFLDGGAETEPFALFVSWHPPHDNGRTKEGIWRYETLPELMNLYDPDKIRFRPNFDSALHDRRSYQGHMAMCSGVDMAFGWLMDKLREKGLEENTLVVFTSDHGDLLGSNGRPWPKGFPENGSVRVPLLLRWPERLAAGRASDLLVGTLDLMPTLLAMLGLPVPSTCQGQDLSAHIAAGRDDAVDAVPLFLLNANWRGVYTPRYTYSTCPVENPKFNLRVLYDRQTDPWEMRNLYDEPGSRALRDELQRLTDAWLRRFQDGFLPIDRINRVCFADGKAPGMRKGETGALLGRPCDCIRAAKL